MGTTARGTAWTATVMGTTAQVTAWTAGGGPWARGPLVLATYYCDFRCLNTKPFFINTDIWASIKCRFPDILIWISEAVSQNLLISHNRGKCLSESPKKKKKKNKTKKHKKQKPKHEQSRISNLFFLMKKLSNKSIVVTSHTNQNNNISKIKSSKY